MRLFAAFVMFTMSGCFATQTSLRSGGMDYEASGFMGPSPMEMSAADLTSAQADRVRAEARTMEAHPELFMGGRGYGGYGYGNYYGGYGYGGAPRVDPNYYGYGQYGYGPQTRDPALEERARGLEEDALDYERRLDALERSEP